MSMVFYSSFGSHRAIYLIYFIFYFLQNFFSRVSSFNFLIKFSFRLMGKKSWRAISNIAFRLKFQNYIRLCYHITRHPPERYPRDRPGIFPRIFATATPLPSAAPVPTTTESTSAIALTTSMPSVYSATAAPPLHEEHDDRVQVEVEASETPVRPLYSPQGGVGS